MYSNLHLMGKPNALIHESSLYLQQHAHNPVSWLPWSTDAFDKARKENKLVLVSIGYSACHWCHVMEHECFEDEEVAALMNDLFVCIKVDREERPDVDGVYMTAVQLMTQRGGWPLNCFTLPDGKPVYGGTYFPKEQWMHILKSLQHTYATNEEKVIEYGMELTAGIAKSENVFQAAAVGDLPAEKLDELVRRWIPKMDFTEGGPTHAPKFPLPSNFDFLLHYGAIHSHDTVQSYVSLTLNKMAWGGIYDQVGGGFSRYSVDMLWKIPHFEKMLYDNGQLLGTYAAAYRYDPQPEYLRTLESVLRWLEREMTSPEGGLFAAQDADSEGVEGKYYVWNQDELKSILGKDYLWFNSLFNSQNKGFWEEDQWVLIRNESWESFLKKNPEISAQKIQQCLDSLYNVRKNRIKPGTDTKCLTAWNAMTVTGLCQAFIATSDASFLKMALQIGKWIVSFQFQENGRLWHTRQNGKSFIDGFLDDYAFTIDAFIQLQQVTADNAWLERAAELEKIARELFLDKKTMMYFFSSSETELIARKMELNDNVLPATNSVMAHNLLSLSYLNNEYAFEKQAVQMLHNMLEGMEMYGSGYSNWALLLLRLQHGLRTVEVPKNKKDEVTYLISPFLLAAYVDSEFFRVCSSGRCSLELRTIEEVLLELESVNQ